MFLGLGIYRRKLRAFLYFEIAYESLAFFNSSLGGVIEKARKGVITKSPNNAFEL